jgi:hypothetical protein
MSARQCPNTQVPQTLYYSSLNYWEELLLAHCCMRLAGKLNFGVFLTSAHLAGNLDIICLHLPWFHVSAGRCRVFLPSGQMSGNSKVEFPEAALLLLRRQLANAQRRAAAAKE